MKVGAYEGERMKVYGVVCWDHYEGWRGLEKEEISKSFSIWWRDLCKTCGGLNESKWFDDMVVRKVGKGDKTQFWKDI